MSVLVQVFGRRDDEAIHAHLRPASEKRQGRKSREVGSGGAAGAMGILPRARAREGWSGAVAANGSAKHGRVRRCERAICAWRDKIGRAIGGESRTLMRAWALSAKSRPELRLSLRSLIGGDGLMMCRC